MLAKLGPAVLAISLPFVDRLIYFPDREMFPPPPGIEERWLTTEDGVRLHAWYAPAAGSSENAPTLVWSHGNAGNIGYRVELQLALAKRGLNVLAYDYRGYGSSQGAPFESGVYLDAQAAFDSETKRGTKPETIVCFGESLGGAVSIELAMRRPCAGVAVVSTFTTLADVARAHYGPFGLLAGGQFDSHEKAPRLSVPFFQAHGDRDEIVPFALGEKLHASVTAPKRFVRVRGASHNDAFETSLLDAVAEFSREVAKGR